jgi:class III lanthionine synthetase
VDVRYEQFCLVDPVFYDAPSRAATVEQRFVTGRELPEGWRCHQRESWTVLSPPDVETAAQGWKVHVSATMDNADTVLDAVWRYCVDRRIAFKFLSDEVALFMRNSKYVNRGGSGKFVTVYPEGPGQLELVLRELGELLDGSPGPYVLSDVRWANGPLYVRYGGFLEQYTTLPDGERVPAITGPDGLLVPDRREPGFSVPDWVAVPDFLAPMVEARRTAQSTEDFPFTVERPLHFSNGGGIYLATDNRDGRQVVLREARPFAGLDPTGADAVRRLLREREFLEKLFGTGVVPELYEHIVCWEHHFLVEEYIEGEILGPAFVGRYPLIHPDVTDEDIATYTAWALDVLGKAEQCLEVLHGAGIGFGDLHPYNIIVTPGGDVRFVDLELASYLADETRPALGASGFVPPDRRTGAEHDRYALACLRFHLFLPLTPLLPLDPAKAGMLANSIRQRFPVPESLLADTVEIVRDRRQETAASGAEPVSALAAAIDAGTPHWPRLRESVCDAILASATPQRPDRLFPGDIDQFALGATGIAFGAAGVLYALARSGAGRFPDHEKWLLDTLGRATTTPPGFYDGLHGIAYVLAELGRVDDALAVLDRAVHTPLDTLPPTVFDGLAGVGLNLLHFAARTGDTSLRDLAVEAGARVADALHGSGDERANPKGGRPNTGLMFGAAGQALLFVRLFEATGEDQYLDLAEEAVRRDVGRCVERPGGSLLVDEGWRAEPYVARGSTGIGLALRAYLDHRPDPELAGTLARIHRATVPEFVIGSGLFAGRAGLLAAAAWLADEEDGERTGELVAMHLHRLAWHIIPYQGFAAFPGNQIMRLSMDFATGSAGVLFAMSAVLDEHGPALPFLERDSSASGRR